MDYLIGGSTNMVLDKKLLKRIEDIKALPEDEKEKIYYFIDMAITYNQTKKHIHDKLKSHRHNACGFLHLLYSQFKLTAYYFI